jgi:hypothetical protein
MMSSYWYHQTYINNVDDKGVAVLTKSTYNPAKYWGTSEAAVKNDSTLRGHIIIYIIIK